MLSKLRGKPYLPCESELLQDMDDDVAEIKLPPFQAVAGGDGEGVVVVVPAFAQGQDAEEPVVAALVVGVVGASAPEVADGVDAPGDVMHHEKTHKAAPDEP